MFDDTFMTISLLDELLLWMRCGQLQRKAREAAELLIEVFEHKIINICIVLYCRMYYCYIMHFSKNA